ncbi:histidine kinase N-terminal 7TM domain-containing protein [Scytonema sp. NUACC26]|uniref:histidine kinase N-terminal 7TM domain-containing diguanylate cyclase n=1 Tax=Scytonema sp. NUACC26 TaxID=3140176 RepID=UPI0034DC24F2
MLFQYNVYFVLLSITAVVSATVAFATWQCRSNSSANKPFIAMMLAITGYATVAAMEAFATALSEKIFWSKLEYVGSGSVITFFLIFAMHFTNKNRWLTPRNTALLWIVPTFNVILVATNEWHGLVWSGFSPLSNEANVVVYEHNLGFFWVMGCVYTYTFTGIVLLIQKSLSRSVMYYKQSRITLAAVAVPLLGATLYMLRLTPVGLNITPMCFMATGLLLFVSIFRFRMFDLIPIAREILIESMSDGVLVLDVKNRIIDINPAAKRLIGTKYQHIGQPVAQVLPEWQKMVNLYYSSESFKTEMFIDLETSNYVELVITVLYSDRKQLTGHLIVLRDITQRYLVESELRQANHRLQNQVLEIELLQTKMREQAVRDGLTNLFNRRYFDEIFPKELSLAEQNSAPVALIILDIDYFKRINDTFGHQAGDFVIQSFTNLLRNYNDFQGIICRYGGEEFVLVFPGLTLEKAFSHAERIRLAFQETRLEFVGKEIYATVSGGVGVFPIHGKTKDELLQAVDGALYTAKLDGRNCIKCVAHS